MGAQQPKGSTPSGIIAGGSSGGVGGVSSGGGGVGGGVSVGNIGCNALGAGSTLRASRIKPRVPKDSRVIGSNIFTEHSGK